MLHRRRQSHDPSSIYQVLLIAIIRNGKVIAVFIKRLIIRGLVALGD